ncbi:MAG: PilZ domain-containing protein [Candidatus Omnitrophica bacterium]|nr:PilZ domain-containing protein [Candidatus Omnitrophota bacterium]
MNDAHDNAGKERREYPRIQEKHIIQCHRYNEESRNAEGVTKDISEGGALFQSSVKYEPGDLLKITVTFEGLKDFLPQFIKLDEPTHLKDIVVILARVRWVKPVHSGSAYEIGISFDGIDDGDKLGISRYVKDKLKHPKK